MSTYEEEVATKLKPAREFSATLNSAIIDTVGMYYIKIEAVVRGEISAREKFRLGCLRKPDETPAKDLVRTLKDTIESTRKIIDKHYPNEMTPEELKDCRDISRVRYELERRFFQGEDAGFNKILLEILETKSRTLGEYRGQYFDTLNMFDCDNLQELVDERRRKTQRELLDRKLINLGISIQSR